MRFDKAVKIEALKPWRKNPRQHGEDVDALVRSIEHFGWTNPILVQEHTNRVIAGHGRLDAARRARLESVPVIFLDMNDHDASAYTIADNKLAELSSWDEAALREAMVELRGHEYDLSLLGFSDDEMNQIVTWESDELDRTSVDESPALPKHAICKPGEVYELGPHRLLCGDSTDHAQVALAMGGGQADMIFTDPPYGVEYVGKTKEALTLANDAIDYAGTMALVTQAARAWPLKPGGVFYVCGPAGNTETAFRLALRAAGYTLRQCLVWVKHHFVMGRQDYHGRHETILYGWADGAPHYFINDRTRNTVFDEEKNLRELNTEALIDLIDEYRRHENTTAWRENRPSASTLHPTMKPIALVAKAIRNSSLPGQIVFDGFGGSGSTLIAAQETGRTAVLIELSPQYCDVIVERWMQLQGEHATRAL